MVKSLLLLGLLLLENEKRKCDRDVKGGTASFKISTSAAEKVKRKEPLLEIEKKAHDVGWSCKGRQIFMHIKTIPFLVYKRRN